MPKTEELSGAELWKAAFKSVGEPTEAEEGGWIHEVILPPCDRHALDSSWRLLERWLDGAGKEKRGVRIDFTGCGWEVRLFEADREDYTRGVGVGSTAPDTICRALAAAGGE